MSRYKAFGIHFAISLLIFFVLLAVIVFWWYPDYFFELDGGWEGLRLIIGVDLVLGPVLTLIVFNKDKPELKTDLTIIGALQTVCLAGGMYVVWSERPIAMVYLDGHFYSMSQDTYTDVGAEIPDLARFPGPAPKRVAVDLPADPAEQSVIRGGAIEKGIPLNTHADLYVAMDKSLIKLSDEYSQEEIRLRDKEFGGLDRWFAEHEGELEEYAFFPLGTRYRYLFLGYERATLREAGVLYVKGPI